MKLHAVHRQARMRETHHQAIVGFGVNGQFARHASALDHQRMIARRLERPVDAAQHAGAGVLDLEHLAVRRRRAHYLAAERLADRLMPEADTEDRNVRCGLGNQIEADAGFVRGAGAGREHDGFRFGGDHIGGRNLVVAMHDNVRPQPAQVMEQVEGEAVVVVDQNDHVFKPAQGLRRALWERSRPSANLSGGAQIQSHSQATLLAMIPHATQYHLREIAMPRIRSALNQNFSAIAPLTRGIARTVLAAGLLVTAYVGSLRADTLASACTKTYL